MTPKTQKVMIAVVVFGIAAAISVAVFHSQGLGLFVDGILLFGLFYYLASPAR